MPNKISGAIAGLILFPIKSLLIDLLLISALVIAFIIALVALAMAPITLFGAGALMIVLMILLDTDVFVEWGIKALLLGIVVTLACIPLALAAVVIGLTAFIGLLGCTLINLGNAVIDGCRFGFTHGLFSQAFLDKMLFDISSFNIIINWVNDSEEPNQNGFRCNPYQILEPQDLDQDKGLDPDPGKGLDPDPGQGLDPDKGQNQEIKSAAKHANTSILNVSENLREPIPFSHQP